MGAHRLRPRSSGGIRSLASSRRAGISIGLLGVGLLAGCSAGDQGAWSRLGLPESASDKGPFMENLWIGSWIAAGIVGVIVWGMIGWAAVRYRRRNNVLPKQNRYNLPMEIFYTAAPFIIVGVLFYFTIVAQNRIESRSPEPQHTIDVVGQKWSWTFNYREANNPEVGQDVYEVGTINATPDLYLPVDESVLFTLSSPDVIHSFWVPSFYRKLDVVPGRLNSFQDTPNKIGVYPGKCTELCGTYHSAMLFNVHVVSRADYNAYLKTLAAKGQVGVAKGPALPDPRGEENAGTEREENVGTERRADAQ